MSKSAGRKRGAVSGVPASRVKNAWHEFVERVSRGREEIVVTRYGKPVMKLVPPDLPEGGSLFGCLSGTVTVHGDIVTGPREVWDADG